MGLSWLTPQRCNYSIIEDKENSVNSDNLLFFSNNVDYIKNITEIDRVADANGATRMDLTTLKTAAKTLFKMAFKATLYLLLLLLVPFTVGMVGLAIYFAWSELFQPWERNVRTYREIAKIVNEAAILQRPG
ncbi:hypothetical protein VE02_00671 [Pseudogymnoascus sp. 03VT05]|nr:hypothetical protein VE02_00671 [Pseudogymnoascus sp. 03VT05]